MLKAVKNPTNPSGGIFSELAADASKPGREQKLLLGMLRMVEKQGATGFTERLRTAFAMDPAVPVERVKQEADLEVLFREHKVQYLADLEEAQRIEVERQVDIAL